MGAFWPTPGGLRRSDLYALSVILAYAASSLSAIFVNKATLTAYGFSYTLTLMLSQLCVSVTAFSLLRALRAIAIPVRTWRELSVLIYPAVFLIMNVAIGLLALRLVNIPMFSAFRRLSVLNVMLLEYFVLGKTATRRVMSTILVMVMGSFLAGLGDVTFSRTGYCLVFLNNFITAANLVAIKKTSAIVRLEALALAYYVSLIALPIVLVLAVFSGDLSAALSALSTRPDLHTPGFLVALSLSAASAFLVNFFTNLCTQITSPLTTAITGQMKNVLQTTIGLFAWGYRVTALNLAGLATALAGSLLFAFYKYQEAMALREGGKQDQLKEIPDPGDTHLDTRSPKGHPKADDGFSIPALSALRNSPGDSAVFMSVPNGESPEKKHVAAPAGWRPL